MSEYINSDQDQGENDIFSGLEKEFGESVPVVDALSLFDEERVGLYGQLRNMAEELNTGQYDNGRATALYLRPIEKSAKVLIDTILGGGEDFDTKIGLIAGIFRADSIERQEIIQTLIGEYGEVSSTYECEDIQKIILDALQSTELPEEDDAATRITGVYCSVIINEIQACIEMLADIRDYELSNGYSEVGAKPEIQSRVSLVDKLKNHLGKHAVDVAKIAAGASIALLLDGVVRRHLKE